MTVARMFLWLALMLPGAAQALCSVVGTTPASFGSISSIAVRTTSQPSSTLNGGLSCTGSLLSLLTSNDHFWGTVSSTQSIESHAWFVGYITNDSAPYAICVLVENGGSGGGVAAPLARKTLQKAIHLGL